MAAFSPMTFLQPELYTAVSSPFPKGPRMGGISPALEKDPRSSHPLLAPPSCLQSFLLPMEWRVASRALAHLGLPPSGQEQKKSTGCEHGPVSGISEPGSTSQQFHSLAV